VAGHATYIKRPDVDEAAQSADHGVIQQRSVRRRSTPVTVASGPALLGAQASANPAATSWPPGTTLRELMEYMGHSSLQATERSVKLLPPLDGTDQAERLNSYLRRRAVN
jgi:hypothetical protein